MSDEAKTEQQEFPDHGEHWVTRADAEMTIKVGESGVESLVPLTVMQVFKNTVNRAGGRMAITDKNGRAWSWNEYYRDVKGFAKSLIKLGFEQHSCVSIIGFNGPEWFIADVGAIAAGGIAAGIYTTNGPQACQYVADHSESLVVVCEDEAQLAKFVEVQDELPHCKALVLFEGAKEASAELRERCSKEVYSWKQFMELGEGVEDEEVERRIAATRPGHCATLIYTSGTTGPPKAVMISHDNITWTARSAARVIDLTADDSEVSYLPLSHIAAQMLDIHMPMAFGSQVYFARPDALKGSLVQTLAAVRPTIFFGVPRVWEKIAERMRAVGATTRGLKKRIATWAKAKGLAHARALTHGGSGRAPGGYGCAYKLVLSKIHQRLGLDRCKACFVAAAPISKETLEYFMSLGIHIYEIFGQSECTGPTTINHPAKWLPGSVGPVMEGAELKLTEENQEIVYRGRHIFMGYMKMPEKTAETIDESGFLHSGDVGRFDGEFLYITGRIKELIITAGGENIPPVLIEQQIKKAMPAISNAVVVGERRKFLAVLLTLKCKVDVDTQEALDDLDGDALTVAAEIGSAARTVSAAAKCDKWAKYIEDGLKTANAAAASRAQRVNAWRLLDKDLSLPGGDLTPTLKLKRSVVYKKHEELVNEIYGGPVQE